ncbi:hypothetical protein [Novosphingobium sp.]|uniref:hypothetical protein n=1 Tax=Novosphingobium sp. TaxID=1874826 RepID=UPI003562A1A9
MRRVPVDNRRGDWPRLAADAIKDTQNAIARQSIQISTLSLALTPTTAPASPVEGETYYDSGTKKVRTWDGTAWQNHW